MPHELIENDSRATAVGLSARALRKNRFGIVLFCISQGVPYYLLTNVRYMLAGGEKPANLNIWMGGLLPALLLLIGIVPIVMARTSLHQHKPARAQTQLAVTQLLCLGALITMLLPLWHHSFDGMSRFGEIDLTCLGVASFYACISFLVVFGVWIRIGKRLITAENPWSLEAATWVFSFNAIAWTYLFFILDVL